MPLLKKRDTFFFLHLKWPSRIEQRLSVCILILDLNEDLSGKNLTMLLSSANVKRRTEAKVAGLAGKLERDDAIKTKIIKVLLQPLFGSHPDSIGNLCL